MKLNYIHETKHHSWYNAVVRLYYRFVAVFYNYSRLMEHDWLLPGRTTTLLCRWCSEFCNAVQHSVRAYFSNSQVIIRQTNNCSPSENTVNFFLNRIVSFSNHVCCTCAPFPALIMFYLSIIFVDFIDYDTNSSVSPLLPILTALWTTKRT